MAALLTALGIVISYALAAQAQAAITFVQRNYATYRVERCQGAGCTSFAQVAISSGTSYIDSGLLPGTPYSYRTRATDAAGNLSPYSNTASATTLESVASQVGEWSGPIAWPMVAVHMTLLHTGEVLVWDGQAQGFDARLWNPAQIPLDLFPITSPISSARAILYYMMGESS